MQLNIQTTLAFTATSCCACGAQFALPSHMLENLRANGKEFFCPNGHSLHYGETTVKALERQLQRERAEHDQTKARLRTATAEFTKERQANNRQKKRAKNGVCPCCKRSFVELARHMKTKHPNYAK